MDLSIVEDVALHCPLAMTLPAMERDISTFLDNNSTIEFLQCRKPVDVHNFKGMIRCARLGLLMDRLYNTQAYTLGCNERCTVATSLCDESGVDWFEHWGLDPSRETDLDLYWSVVSDEVENWLDFLRRQLGDTPPPDLTSLCDFLEACSDKTYHWLPGCEGEASVLVIFKYNHMSGSVFFAEDWVDPVGIYM